MDDDPTVKKMAEATEREGGRLGKATMLITLWSDGVITECSTQTAKAGSTQDTEFGNEENVKREFLCGTEKPEMPATRFFESLGEIERAGFTVKVLYDSESITTESELGDVRSFLTTGKLP